MVSGVCMLSYVREELILRYTGYFSDLKQSLRKMRASRPASQALKLLWVYVVELDSLGLSDQLLLHVAILLKNKEKRDRLQSTFVVFGKTSGFGLVCFLLCVFPLLNYTFFLPFNLAFIQTIDTCFLVRGF